MSRRAFGSTRLCESLCICMDIAAMLKRISPPNYKNAAVHVPKVSGKVSSLGSVSLERSNLFEFASVSWA